MPEPSAQRTEGTTFVKAVTCFGAAGVVAMPLGAALVLLMLAVADQKTHLRAIGSACCAQDCTLSLARLWKMRLLLRLCLPACRAN